MKKVAFLFSAIIGMALMAQGQTDKKWNIDRSHSNVGFTVTHFFSDVTGKFDEFSGEFIIDPDNISKSKITFTIPVNSVNTDNEKRDGHLMTDDFFSAESYPSITFESTGFKKTGNNKYLMIGNLTMKDVTKKVEIPFEVKGVMDHPMVEGATLMGLSFNTELMRTEYNVGTGKWAMTKVVGDKVLVDIDLELIHKKG